MTIFKYKKEKYKDHTHIYKKTFAYLPTFVEDCDGNECFIWFEYYNIKYLCFNDTKIEIGYFKI